MYMFLKQEKPEMDDFERKENFGSKGKNTYVPEHSKIFFYYEKKLAFFSGGEGGGSTASFFYVLPKQSVFVCFFNNELVL